MYLCCGDNHICPWALLDRTRAIKKHLKVSTLSDDMVDKEAMVHLLPRALANLHYNQTIFVVPNEHVHHKPLGIYIKDDVSSRSTLIKVTFINGYKI